VEEDDEVEEGEEESGEKRGHDPCSKPGASLDFQKNSAVFFFPQNLQKVRVGPGHTLRV
jgi:hypothetical protein